MPTIKPTSFAIALLFGTGEVSDFVVEGHYPYAKSFDHAIAEAIAVAQSSDESADIIGLDITIELCSQ